MKNKVTLIYPKVRYRYDRTPYPPLGIGYLAAIAREFCQIEIIDGQILTLAEYDDLIGKTNSGKVLISTTLLQLKEGLRVANSVKKRSPKSIVVMGGPAFGSVKTEDLIRDAPVDIVVIGEAENVILDIVSWEKASSIRAKIGSRNMIRMAGGTFEINTVRNKPDLAKIPLPAWDMLSIEKYLDRWSKETGMTSLQIIGSRGCPFSCSFCDKTVTGSKYRSRPVEIVANEISYLVANYSPDDIFYDDDLFTVGKERVFKMCEKIAAINTRWSAQARVDTVTFEMLVAMKQAGCRELYFGVESGSERILKILNKKTSRKQIVGAFELCHKVGVKPGAYLMVGVPGETKLDIQETIKLVNEIRPAMLNFSFLMPFPGTKIFQQTKHLISEEDYSRWDDFSNTIYEADVFEIAPEDSKKMIEEEYQKLVVQGVEVCDWYKKII